MQLHGLTFFADFQSGTLRLSVLIDTDSTLGPSYVTKTKEFSDDRTLF